MEQLAALLAPTEVLLISDEVYEHMVYDGVPHVSASSIPALAARSLRGLELRQDLPRHRLEGGHVAAPAALTAEFRKVHQFNVFTVNTPMQHAWRATWPTRALPRAAGLLPAQARPVPRRPARTRLRLLPSEGTYFQSVDYSAVSSLAKPTSASG
jgi:methionine aminotransferase